MIPAKIQQKKCKALIDTGVSRSCMSEKNYHEQQLPPLSELFAVKVTSATGTPIKVLGIMVCRNVRRSTILGIDFLRKYRIGTNWTGKGQLKYRLPLWKLLKP